MFTLSPLTITVLLANMTHSLLHLLQTRMDFLLPLAAGYLLDLLFGDPEGLPHPIRFFGFLIAKGEAWLNKPSLVSVNGGELINTASAAIGTASGKRMAFLKGMAFTLLLCIGTFIGLHSLLTAARNISMPLYFLISSLCVFYGLAGRQLIREGAAVFSILQARGLAAGRLQLSRIVGRDTSELSERQVRIAVLETLAENLGDGVVAPLFYYALAGVPGMLTYKMINTLDSMIGYHGPRYEQFGKFAARLDDLANFIPARLTALLMVSVSGSRKGMEFAIRYGHRHKSPNAGYPEAALAGIMDLRFGGPNRYQGLLVDKPYIGDNGRKPGAEEIGTAIGINQRTGLLMMLLVLTWGIAT
jgi:adenosylcobinamide-phosphate synthase